VAVDFGLEGKNWEFGDYNATQVIAEGSFKNGVLTLLPLRLESEETLLAFNGQIGGTQQSGQLQVRNFPVEVLDNFVKLPNNVKLTGKLNATATLAGDIANPQAVGELQLTDGTLNQNALESALSSFSYADARLNFGSNVVVSGPEPITITGSVPFQLPFATVKPDNQIRLDVNVQNQGLALLNLFTNSVAWKDGQGQVQLQVRGTTQQPLATGIATVNNATITAEALPEPLTDVTGTVRFDFDRILVEGLQGNFSKGKVIAQGVIPIFKNLQPDDPDITTPLTVSLDQLALNLPALYQGGASGNVVITGSALNPIIGGEVQLADGEVLLTDPNATTPTSSGGTSGVVEALRGVESGSGSTADGGFVPEFNNLRLTLGDDVAIVRPPILNFQATGTLILNGTRNDTRPRGTISLSRGNVNLFTTQFVLARGYEHTATFSPNQGLDPTLDIRLIAAVPEVTQRRVPLSPVSSEIAETRSTNVGGLETVRVQARVTGPASQLFDHLELTSDPARSQSEIIALIGGGFVDTLGRGDSALGIANIASSALLGNFQGTITNIGNRIGLSELRIFPTLTTEERSRDSTLGLAAEAGIDISRDIYFSVLKVLTATQPTRFGVVYRLNDRVRVRTSTDLSGDTSAVVEYENRF
jgi:translocation and assembly module TamB